MKKITVKYVIYGSQKTDNGRYPIKLRFTYNRKSKIVPTNLIADENDLIRLKPGEDPSKSREIKTTSLRRRVEDLVRKYEDAALSFDSNLFPDWTVTQVVKYIDNYSHKEVFHLPFVRFSQSIIEMKEKTSHQAALNYKAAVKALSEFLHMPEFDISCITSSVMYKFQEWLEQKYGRQARAVSEYTSTIGTIHKQARKQYNSEENDDVKIKNPFEYYKAPSQPRSGHRNVDISIIQGMINDYSSLQGRERLAVAAFLLSFGLMGMNTPDIYECPVPKNGIITYCRHKTRDRRADMAEIQVKIPEELMPLYNEYKDELKKRAFKFYRRYSTYKNMQDAECKGMNEYIKRINYKGRITNYSARHSWATIARSAECKISIDLIDDCLNHISSHPIGDIYAKKDYSVMWEANEKVVSLFTWDPIH